MDLLTKAVIVAVVIAVVIVSAYYLLRQSSANQVTKAQATSLILDYLKNNYPGATVNITNVSSSVYAGSWYILASVISNSTSPCPSYSVLSFDYPQYGFVSRVENNYTGNCIVNGFANNHSSYIVASYPVAIALSHELNISSVNSYVQKAGYANVSVHATYYGAINYSNTSYQKVWLVDYSSSKLNYSVQVLLSQVGGNPLAVRNVS
ncbi:MAG: hypothetical protein M1520_00115 [Candidatus Marsarchaeota archaeon]|jgi:hypothetical protein|nr:hypothetical protein [Candidatus Marsarchaeota archaeon]